MLMAWRILHWPPRQRLSQAVLAAASRGVATKAKREKLPTLDWLLDNYEKTFPGLLYQRPGKSEAWMMNDKVPTAMTAVKMLRKLSSRFAEMPRGARPFKANHPIVRRLVQIVGHNYDDFAPRLPLSDFTWLLRSMGTFGGREWYQQEMQQLLEQMRPDVHFAATADDATRNAITASKQLTFSDLARMLHAMRDAHHKIAWLEEFENALVRLAKPTTTLTVLTSILQSFAFFNYTPERLLEKLPHTDDGTLRGGEHSILLWVMGTLHKTDHPIVPALWALMVEANVDLEGGALKGDLQNPSTHMHRATLSRLALAAAWTPAEHMVGQLSLSDAQQTKQIVRDAWAAQMLQPRREAEAKGLVKISALQSEVQDVLRSLGHPSELEVLIPQLGVVLDVHIPSLNVYLEFDGPSHFFRNEPFNTEYNAGTRRKTEWLKSEGIKVARVGFLEWEGNSEERRAVLSAKLANLQ